MHYSYIKCPYDDWKCRKETIGTNVGKRVLSVFICGVVFSYVSFKVICISYANTGIEINFRIHKQLIKSYKQNFIIFKILEALVFLYYWWSSKKLDTVQIMKISKINTWFNNYIWTIIPKNLSTTHLISTLRTAKHLTIAYHF